MLNTAPWAPSPCCCGSAMMLVLDGVKPMILPYRLFLAAREQGQEPARPVQRNEILVAADVEGVDVDLRHRPPAGALHHFAPELRIEIDAKIVDVGHALRLQVALRLDAIR